MSPTAISDLLDAWRSAERMRDGGAQNGDGYTAANEAVEKARRAYLKAAADRAVKYGYAGGLRSVQQDIDHLQEAEDRRSASQPSTPEYHQATRDVEDRALRILTQVIEDEAAADRERTA